jgi:hypothetical protein
LTCSANTGASEYLEAGAAVAAGLVASGALVAVAAGAQATKTMENKTIRLTIRSENERDISFPP